LASPKIHCLAQETTDAANVGPALVNATRRTAPLRKICPLHLHHLHPHLGTTTCRRNTPMALCFPGSSRTIRLIRNVVMKLLNSLSHVISTLGALLGLYKRRTCHCKCVFSLLNIFCNKNNRHDPRLLGSCNRRGHDGCMAAACCLLSPATARLQPSWV
jgi:hypothetical protein